MYVSVYWFVISLSFPGIQNVLRTWIRRSIISTMVKKLIPIQRLRIPPNWIYERSYGQAEPDHSKKTRAAEIKDEINFSKSLDALIGINVTDTPHRRIPHISNGRGMETFSGLKWNQVRKRTRCDKTGNMWGILNNTKHLLNFCRYIYRSYHSYHTM